MCVYVCMYVCMYVYVCMYYIMGYFGNLSSPRPLHEQLKDKIVLHNTIIAELLEESIFMCYYYNI